MKWCADPTSKDGLRWRCRRKVAGAKCSQSQGMRHGSWFQQSNLTFQEVLYLTYDIVCRVPAHQIQREYAFTSKTIADWGMFCRETMLVYVGGALKRSAVLTRPSRLTRACSVGENTKGDTLLRASGCSAVPNVSLAEHFLCQYRTEPLTP